MALSRKSKNKLIVSTILFTIITMVLSPSSSINPTEIGFYGALVGGSIWGLLMYWSFNKYLKEEVFSRERANKLDRTLRICLVVATVAFTFAMMFLSRYGSSNPSEPDFYVSIAGGLAFGLINYWAYNKYFKPTGPYLEDMQS